MREVTMSYVSPVIPSGKLYTTASIPPKWSRAYSILVTSTVGTGSYVEFEKVTAESTSIGGDAEINNNVFYKNSTAISADGFSNIRVGINISDGILPFGKTKISYFFRIKSIRVLVLTHELGEVDILHQKQTKN